MSVSLRYSRLVAIALGTILLPQARRARRTIPRLPAAAQPWAGLVDYALSDAKLLSNP